MLVFGLNLCSVVYLLFYNLNFYAENVAYFCIAGLKFWGGNGVYPPPGNMENRGTPGTRQLLYYYCRGSAPPKKIEKIFKKTVDN
jgi:hypothetical protein